MARALYNGCCSEELPAAVLMHFCSAGDTRNEAGQLVSEYCGSEENRLPAVCIMHMP
jgi:hypothetical protein